MKAVLLVALIAVIAAAGCVSQTPAPELPAPPAGPPGGNAVDVTITSSGFSPDDITVDAGTTVRWTNQDTAAHWPASDVHPFHQDLPGFDTLRGLAQGETYEFTFTKAGTWGYHDHLRPGLVGTVTVAGLI